MEMRPTDLERCWYLGEDLAPGLEQPFFIGDRSTGRGTGTAQQFIVPAGSTRLFLGVVDGSEWSNNVGSFSVTVSGVN
jgi:hypothetical protein